MRVLFSGGKRTWVVKLGIGLAAMLALAWLVSWLASDGLPVTGSFSDGKHRLELLATGVNTVSYSSDSRMRAVVRKWFPKIAMRVWGANSSIDLEPGQIFDNVETHFLLPFMRLTNADGHRGEADKLLSEIRFFEPTGFVFHERFDRFTTANETFVSSSIGAFPRRWKRLKGEIIEKGSGEPVLAFSIANPGYVADPPEWTPDDVLPCSKSDDAVRVLVRGLKIDEKAYRVRPDVEVTAVDPNWSRHEVDCHFLDATGNVSDWLSPYEPAWKLLVDVRRKPDAEYGDEEKVVVGPYSIPKAGEIADISRDVTLGGESLRLREMCGAGISTDATRVMIGSAKTIPGAMSLGARPITAVAPGSPMIYTVEARSPVFLVESLAGGHAWRVQARAFDEHGAALQEPGSFPMMLEKLIAWEITPKPDSTQVTIEVMVNRPQRFEFLLKPPEEMRN